jgi:CheY-like chemotaxis protein
VAQTISAIAALMWPALLLIALLMFRRPLRRVIQSAEQRKWTLKVGGQELGMEELSNQQNAMIADLQKQVGALNRVLGELSLNAQVVKQGESRHRLPTELNFPPRATMIEQPASAHAVLWVDDHPENNALLIEQLQQNAVRVDLAKSTTEALAYLDQRRYGAILSDMGRTEDGKKVPDAGMRMLRAVRDSGRDIPVLFYTSSFAARAYAQDALAGGATVITSSPTILFEHLQALQLL